MTVRHDAVWAALSVDYTPHGMIQRRVLADSPHDCFLVESRPSGDLMLRLSLANQDQPPNVPIPGTKGMVCNVAVDGRSVQIDLKLATREHEPLFRTLVDEVLELVTQAEESRCATEVLAYVRACMGFWSRSESALSKEAAAGLYAELHVLQHVLLPAMAVAEALQQWTGPSGAPHDFQFAGGAIEVKSWRGKGAPAPTISSELQLSIPQGGDLRLHVVSVDQRVEGPGETISEKAEAITQSIEHQADRVQFRSLLVESGWTLASQRTRTEKYTVLDETTWDVTDTFPRITPETVPASLRRVSYVLDTAGLDKYKLKSLTLEGLTA